MRYFTENLNLSNISRVQLSQVPSEALRMKSLINNQVWRHSNLDGGFGSYVCSTKLSIINHLLTCSTIFPVLTKYITQGMQLMSQGQNPNIIFLRTVSFLQQSLNGINQIIIYVMQKAMFIQKAALFSFIDLKQITYSMYITQRE